MTEAEEKITTNENVFPCRGPISIFGPIFKVEDRSEDPDLRIAERSWWPLEESEEEVPGGLFVHSSGREGGKWGVLRFGPRKWKMGAVNSFFGSGRSKNPPSSKTPPIFEEVPPPPPSSFFRPMFDSFSGAEDRRLKMGASSIFCENRRWRGLFDLRLSKNDDEGFFEDT